MTADLWAPGWDVDEQAHVDVHGPPPRHRTGFESDPWHGYARPATASPREFDPYRPIADVVRSL
ncbi:hypothetical protein ACFQ6Q_04395 [Streptomyces sp. NPDC056437]|uniref:hypothetical protein n=1 Tax=Streptomyces sp. NPDC056437 TaxID=3345816 RepID=UPI0036CEFA5D